MTDKSKKIVIALTAAILIIVCVVVAICLGRKNDSDSLDVEILPEVSSESVESGNESADNTGNIIGNNTGDNTASQDLSATGNVEASVPESKPEPEPEPEETFSDEQSANAAAKELVAAVSAYEWRLLDRFVAEEYVFDDREKATVAAFSVSEQGFQSYNRSNYEETYAISMDKYTSAAQALYGAEAVPEMTEEREEKTSSMQAYAKDGKVLIIYYLGEVVNDHALNQEYGEMLSDSEYVYHREVFWDYWANNHGASNYRVSYTVKACAESKYGCILTNISFEKIR